MNKLTINLFSVSNSTGETRNLNLKEKKKALEIIISEGVMLFKREKDNSPKGKIELYHGEYYMCSNWIDNQLIVDSVLINQ